MTEATRDGFGREMPYDNATLNASVESLRRWRDYPDKYPFVVGAVLPLLQGYEAYQDAWDHREQDEALWRPWKSARESYEHGFSSGLLHGALRASVVSLVICIIILTLC